MIGVKKDEVKLVPHDPNWKEEYFNYRNELLNILGDNVIEICHIGSTAIIGIMAKPILDINVIVKCTNSINFNGMKEAGYNFHGEHEIFGHLFDRKNNNDNVTHFIKCYPINNENHIRVVKFRDFMNNYPEYVKQYNELKIKLAKEYTNNRIAYQKGKTEFIEKINKIIKDM